MNESESTAAQAVIPADVLLNGGQTITVKTLKGDAVEVKVRLVAIRELSKYLDIINDLPAFISFLTGKDATFVDGLTDKAIYEIDTIGKSLNDPRIEPFLERQQILLEKISLMTKKVKQAIASAT